MRTLRSNFSLWRPVDLESEEPINTLVEKLESHFALQDFLPERFHRMMMLGSEATSRIQTDEAVQTILMRAPETCGNALVLPVKGLRVISITNIHSEIGIALTDPEGAYRTEARRLREITTGAFPNPSPPFVKLGSFATQSLHMNIVEEIAHEIDNFPNTLRFEPLVSPLTQRRQRAS